MARLLLVPDLLAALLPPLMVVLAQASASSSSSSLLLPNETLCGHEFYTNGVVIEASHFVSTQKYFSCETKFKANATVHADFRWVIRIERMFIPYTTVDPLVIVPPTVHIHTSNETYIIQYQKDLSNYAGVVIHTQQLALQFINLPQDSSYKLIITLDTGDHDCVSGFKCHRNDYCIDNNLLCDGENHCGDGTDEFADVCPDPADVVVIVIIAIGSSLLAALVGLSVMLVLRCRTKLAVHYNVCRHEKQVAVMSKRATLIRDPSRNTAKGSAEATSVRCSGLGYQPAPLVIRHSATQVGVHQPRRSSDGTASCTSARAESAAPSCSPQGTESVSSDTALLV